MLDGEETENEVETSQNLRSQLLRGGSSDSEYSSKNGIRVSFRGIYVMNSCYIRYFCFFADLNCIPDFR